MNLFFKSYKENVNTYLAEQTLFFERSVGAYNDIFERNIQTYVAGFNALSNQYNTILSEKEQKNETEAWDFSLFNIIKIKRPEENLHSPMLLDLLNTQGLHGQKDLFYKLFLATVISDNLRREEFTNENYTHYNTIAEEFIRNEENQGRIDLNIKSTNPQKKFAIIIENKWESGDSCENQLLKYYDNFIKLKGYTDDNLLLIYLTKHGGDPVWITDAPFLEHLERIRDKSYFPISYGKHIYEWLEKCINNCKSVKVKIILKQYQIFIQ